MIHFLSKINSYYIIKKYKTINKQIYTGIRLVVELEKASNQQEIVKYIVDMQEQGHKFTRTDYASFLKRASELPIY